MFYYFKVGCRSSVRNSLMWTCQHAATSTPRHPLLITWGSRSRSGGMPSHTFALMLMCLDGREEVGCTKSSGAIQEGGGQMGPQFHPLDLLKLSVYSWIIQYVIEVKYSHLHKATPSCIPVSSQVFLWKTKWTGGCMHYAIAMVRTCFA